MLLTIHLAAAKVLDTPELQLAEEEAQVLAAAVQRVADQYDSVVNPKLMAWLQLSLVAGSIYGTRIYSIRARQKQEAKESRPAPAVGAAAPRIVNMPAGKTSGAAAQTPADIFGTSYSGTIAAEV